MNLLLKAKKQENYSHKSLEEKPSRLFSRINSKKSDNSFKQNEFIFPSNLSIRDGINKYYNITEKMLGKGSSGIVYVGERNGKQYAIKKIKKKNKKVIKTFILEPEISLQLKYENIITYYEIYEDSEYINYVKEIGEGGTLFSFISGCPLGHLPADIVIELLIQILGVDIICEQKKE